MNFEERGYFTDSYRIDFTARVRDVRTGNDGRSVVYLDKTFFYPASGGQPDDRGTLDGKRVIEVTEDADGVRHVVDGEIEPGSEVEGRIDWSRRFDHMQQHSGQHLLSRVILEMLGARTVGFHLGERICTIDIDIDTPSQDKMDDIEIRANELVMKNIPLQERLIGRDEYETMIREEKDSPAGEVRSRLPDCVESVRMVDIAGIDRSTCCGTHCGSTGEIGIIKLLGAERMKGRARIEFVCGGRAVLDYAGKHRLIGSLALRFSTDWRMLDKVVDKISEETRALRKANEELNRELAGVKALEISKPTGSVGGFDLVMRVFKDADIPSLREKVMRIREAGGKVILFGTSGPKPGLIFACSPEVPLDMGELMKGCVQAMGGRGGGGRDLAQGGGGDGALVGKALDECERRIREALE